MPCIDCATKNGFSWMGKDVMVHFIMDLLMRNNMQLICIIYITYRGMTNGVKKLKEIIESVFKK